jgi:POT family proton-dependent oligopeptide transporter
VWGGGALVVIAAWALWQRASAGGIQPSAIRDAAGYSLVLITVVFFARLFLDRSWTREERGRLAVIFVFFACAAIFWAVFEQAGSTLNLFADRSTRNQLLGMNFPSSWFQALNALFIITLAPVMAWLWVTLGKRQPSSPSKFAFGLIGVGLGFAILVPGAMAAASGSLVSPLWLTIVYLIHTLSELCLSPVGLSSMTKLAPPRVVGSMMGVWFLGASIGNFLAGQTATFYESMPLERLLGAVSVMPIVAGILMLVFSKPLTRMMSGAD